MSAEKTYRSWDNVLLSLGLIAIALFWMRGFWRPDVSRSELHIEQEVVQAAPRIEKGNKGSRSLLIEVKADRHYRISSDYALWSMDIESFLIAVQPGDTLFIGVTDERWPTVLSVADQSREYIDLDAYNAGRRVDSKLGLIFGPVVVLVTLLFWFLRRRLPFLK
jgi:hypothetical protein